jgi:hypothetical protein
VIIYLFFLILVAEGKEELRFGAAASVGSSVVS